MRIFHCQICNQDIEISLNVKPFTTHLKHKHNLKPNQYYNQFLKKNINDGLCIVCKKQTLFINIFKGYKRYCSKLCGSNGPNNVFKRKDIQDQIKKTNLKKYGFEQASRNPEIIKKQKQTCLERYGVETTLLDPTTKEKIERTNLQKYGVKNPFDNEEIQRKAKRTIKKKYGGIGRGSKIINDRIRKGTKRNHGVDNYASTLEFREFAREKFINDFEYQTGEKIRPRKGHYENEVFSKLQVMLDESIEFDHIIHGYYPDAFIPSLNLILELDEPWHKLKWAIKHDKIKNDTYYKYGYHVFRIPLKKWLNDIESVKSEFLSVIKEIKDTYGKQSRNNIE